MSILSQIERISGNVSSAFSAIARHGVTIPDGATSDDLADLIAQINGVEPPGSRYVYFDNGYVNNVFWQINGMTRPNYTSYGGGTLQYVYDGGYILLRVSNGGSTYYHYGLASTVDTITVPDSASELCVEAAKNGSETGVSIQFGLVRPNASNSISVTGGGVMSSLMYVGDTAYSTFTLPIPDTLRGDNNLVIAVHIRGQANSAKGLRIRKVWFR